MVLLDEVQELRGLPEDSFELVEHKYAVHGLETVQGVMGAFDFAEEAGEDLFAEHPDKCLLLFGRRVVGAGDNWDDAYRMARERGADPLAAVRFLTYRDPGYTLLN